MRCRKCYEEKSEDDFGTYNLKGTKHRRLTCNKCMTERNKENRHKLAGNRFKGMTKKCSYCDLVKPIEEYEPGRNKCNQCRREDRKQKTKSSKEAIQKAVEWQKRNPERRKKIALAYYYRLQDSAIKAYGGYRCACCGETEPLFLTLDHVNNDGKSHRKMLGTLGGAKLYKWLRDNNYPSGFQVLCSNCNHGKQRNGGICPHKTRKV